MRSFTTLSFGIIAFAAATSRADDTFQFPEPQAEHEWLHKFVGEWTSTSEATFGPDQTFECTGTISSQMLGGFWVINDMSNDMPGMPGMQMRGLQTIGYDPKKGKYVGTWVDTSTNHMWQYEGEIDESGTKISLYAEGPNFDGSEGTAMFRDSYEFVSDDEMHITSEMQGADGQWITFMTGVAHRTSAEGQ